MSDPILEFEDSNTYVKVYTNEFGKFVTISESGRSLCFTVKGLTRIAKVVADYFANEDQDAQGHI